MSYLIQWQYVNFPAVYTVNTWSELLSVTTNKPKLWNYSCHRAKPKHLEADSATGSCGCDNRRPVLATGRSNTVRPCSWGTVQSRRGWYAYGSPYLSCTQESRAWFTLMKLMSLSYFLLIAKPWLQKVPPGKGKCRSQTVITSLTSLVKGIEKQSRVSNSMKGKSEL